jgi:hypothetical protein
MQDGHFYIRGHGEPRKDYIMMGRGGERLRYDEVVNWIMQSGLPKTFSGKIKCNNCHSAESIPKHPARATSFAQHIADEMHWRG